MTTKEHRKAIPLGVKLKACLLLLKIPDIAASTLTGFATKRNLPVRIDCALMMLGFTADDIDAGIHWDHQPALTFREIVDGKMIPDPNDPHYIRPMRAAEHRIKTSGTKATSAGSDVHMSWKIKRITGETPKKRKQKIPGRPFPKRTKKPPAF